MIRHVLLNLFVIALAVQSARCQNALRAASSNLVNGLAIQGYDPVTYFQYGKAVKGKKEFAVQAEGVTYYCSSSFTQDLLSRDYKKFEPQYGGWCAYAMGNSGDKVEIDPETFKIIDGKLYLFYNAYFNNTLNTWNKDESNLHRKADANWKKYFK